jgi:hypothetical protein
MTAMKIYENGLNWVIEDQLDQIIVEKINNLIDENLNSFLKLKKGHSTKGKNAEQYWLIRNDDIYLKNKNFENLKNKYKFEILNRLKKSDILDEKIHNIIDIKNTGCWTVIGEENSYHIPHSHGGGLDLEISTVLYLKIPETNIEDEPDNNLYLIMNSGPVCKIYSNKPKYITINPIVGKLLIFPEWIIHGTCPQTKGIRQTFNTDYRFIHKKQNDSILKYS